MMRKPAILSLALLAATALAFGGCMGEEQVFEDTDAIQAALDEENGRRLWRASQELIRSGPPGP